MYETEEGSVEEIFDALFAEDAVFNIGDGKTMPRETFMQAVGNLRSMPPSERVVEVSDFREEGDTVWFRLRTRMPDADTGEPIETDRESVFRFNADGMVVETGSPASQADQDDLDATFRSMGVDV
jgi:hypothetical protein